MSNSIFVSVIMPVRNEAASIVKTIESILQQDYPPEQIEILIADGLSTDGTDRILINYEKINPKVKYLVNKGKIVPTGLNLAIQKSKGDVILRMDAHSYYPKNYISTLVKALYQFNADNIGCAIQTIPANESLKAKAIAIGLSSPFGVGNSMFRVGVNRPMEVETVPFGCFRREVFDTIGLFDEDLVRNQDDEFNARMIKSGYKIILIPGIECRYIARDTFKRLSLMLYQYGLFKPIVNYKLKQIATIRQLIPLFLVCFIFFGALLIQFIPLFWVVYLLGILVYISFIKIGSLKEYIRDKQLKLFLLLPFTFGLMHISYGIGYIHGIIKLILRKPRVEKEIQLSR